MTPLLEKLIPTARRHRAFYLAAFDTATWTVVAAAGIGTVAELTPETYQPRLLSIAALAVVMVTAVLAGGWATGVYTRRWRLGEYRQVRASVISAIAPTMILAAQLAIVGQSLLWAVIGCGYGALALLLSVSVRATWRVYNDRQTPFTVGEPTIIFGAGSSGRMLLEALAAEPNPTIRPVALLDDDHIKHGRQIAGLQVLGGRDKLKEVARFSGASELVVAISSASGELLREVESESRTLGLRISIIPSLAELVGRAVRPSDVRSITPADLLGRRPVDLDLERRSSYLTGTTTLVTGAGGSIGSELCRQLHRLGIGRLLMVDRDESALHALQLALDGQGQLDSDHLIVADIRDPQRLDELFARWKPDVVFHAAALKHLPLLEMHPNEGIKTNICGTHNVLEASITHGVKRFVNISTDKAADPSSVLGWTKQLAEQLTTKAGLRTSRPYISVRFGNVLGSRGSVLTAFTRQIEDGGPVTVTHPDVTRFFMTVEEAAGLVIAAGETGNTGDVMILEMGEPVSILAMAQELISRSGRNIDIVFTGLRPGEKMHEVLKSNGELAVKTEDGLMWRGSSYPIDWDEVEPILELENPDEQVELLVRLTGSQPAPVSSRILLSPPEIGDDERRAVNAALDSGWIAPAGPDLTGFQEDIQRRTGAEAVLAVSSGTAALHLGLLALGVEPGDEVVVQTTTFAASAFAVCHAGAIPVLCDVEPETGMLDPALLAEFLDARARVGRLPKVVMPVDLYGACANYDAINAVCRPYGIPVLQDAAESLGAISQGVAAGTHGNLGAFSFNGNKIITTSGGGALIGSVEAIEYAAKLASQAREPVAHYEHHEVGYNYRMSNILAALGRAQLQSLDRRIARRRTVRSRYLEALPQLGWMPDGVTERPNYWLTVALLPEGVSPERVAADLDKHGIEARRSWKPMHLQPVFEEAESIGGSCAEEFYGRGLCLPSSQSLSPSQIQRVIGSLEGALPEPAMLSEVAP